MMISIVQILDISNFICRKIHDHTVRLFLPFLLSDLVVCSSVAVLLYRHPFFPFSIPLCIISSSKSSSIFQILFAFRSFDRYHYFHMCSCVLNF